MSAKKALGFPFSAWSEGGFLIVGERVGTERMRLLAAEISTVKRWYDDTRERGVLVVCGANYFSIESEYGEFVAVWASWLKSTGKGVRP